MFFFFFFLAGHIQCRTVNSLTPTQILLVVFSISLSPTHTHTHHLGSTGTETDNHSMLGDLTGPYLANILTIKQEAGDESEKNKVKNDTLFKPDEVRTCRLAAPHVVSVRNCVHSEKLL